MRIISNSRGDYVQVLEEFTRMSPTQDYVVKWDIVLFQGQVSVYYERSTRVYTKHQFIEYVDDLKLAQWRNPNLKEDRMELFDKLLQSLIKWERELKINEVLRDENEYQYWVC